jgi:ribosomal-protein-alanine N-acetyltransferase
VTAIRGITAADLPVLAALHARSFPEAWDQKSLADLIAAPGTVGLIAEPDQGFILIRTVADEAEILTICVAERVRRSGVGGALLRAAAGRAAEAGAGTMFLEVVADNEPAKALYNRHGFAAVGVRYAYYRGRDALIMRAGLPLTLAVGNAGKTL